MSDGPPRKRRWLQVHLSTAVVLMVVAGVLVWANATPTFFRLDSTYDGIGQSMVPPMLSETTYGWPFEMAKEELGIFSITEGFEEDKSESTVSSVGLMANCAVALAILTAVAVGCEWWVRRRERELESG